MLTVDETIKDWTEDEKELLKDLIDECRQREKDNLRARIETARGLMRLVHNVTGQLAEEVIKITGSQVKGRA